MAFKVKDCIGKYCISMIKEPNFLDKPRPPLKRGCPQGGGLITKCSMKY